MTAMFDDDDDFEVEDVLEEKSTKLTTPQQRLNQTQAVFACSKRNDEMFVPPPPVGQKKAGNSPEDVERFKKLHLKAQGEASILRGELDKQNKKFNEERINLRQIESNLKDKMKEEKNKYEVEFSKAKTEKVFLLQEMQGLKDQIVKLEAERAKESQALDTTVKKRKVLDAIKTEKNSFPTDKDFKRTIALATTETQTEVVGKRRCSLKKIDKTKMSSLSFAKLTKASSDVKMRLFQQTTPSDLALTVSQTIQMLIKNITDNFPNFPSTSELSTLQTLISVNNSRLSSDDRALVTETCSKLFHLMIKTETVTMFESVLSLVLETWSRQLLSQDITSDILALMIQLATNTSVQELLSAAVMAGVFRLLSLVTAEADHCRVLCRQTEGQCQLSSILILVESSLRQGLAADVAEAGCGAMVAWLEQSLTAAPAPAWVTNQCPDCTKMAARCLVLLTQTQVDRRATQLAAGEQLLPALRRCVRLLAKLQDSLEAAEGKANSAGSESESGWSTVINENAYIQRMYIWSVSRLQEQDLGDRVAAMLQGLSMDVRNSSADK